MMESRLSHAKVVTYLGTILVIPWELLITAGFTLSFRTHESFWTWAFVWSGFLLNIPAILLSKFRPALGASWVLVNVATSMTIGLVFEWRSYIENASDNKTFSGFVSVFHGLGSSILLFWFAPMAFAFAMLIALLVPHRSHKTASSEIKPIS